MVSWESQLERKCIWYLEYSPAVLAYEEQPLVLEYSDGGGNARRAIPDFSVRLSDGSNVHAGFHVHSNMANGWAFYSPTQDSN